MSVTEPSLIVKGNPLSIVVGLSIPITRAPSMNRRELLLLVRIKVTSIASLAATSIVPSQAAEKRDVGAFETSNPLRLPATEL